MQNDRILYGYDGIDSLLHTLLEQSISLSGNYICIWGLFHMCMGCATILYEEENMMSDWVIMIDPLLSYCREDGMGSWGRIGNICFIANIWNIFMYVMHFLLCCVFSFYLCHLWGWFMCQKFGSEITLNISRLYVFFIFSY